MILFDTSFLIVETYKLAFESKYYVMWVESYTEHKKIERATTTKINVGAYDADDITHFFLFHFIKRHQSKNTKLVFNCRINFYVQ